MRNYVQEKWDEFQYNKKSFTNYGGMKMNLTYFCQFS